MTWIFTIGRFLWRYKRAVLAAIASAFLVSGIAYALGHFRGYQEGKKAAIAASDAAAIELRNEQNEVRNLRPDTRALINRLRRGQF